MIYNCFQDIRLSGPGFGAMRLPVIDGDDSCIDEAAVMRMVDTAMEKRARVHRRRVHRTYGPERPAARKAAVRVPEMPVLRAGLSSADQNIRGAGGFF